jgi:hypothetical protein
MIVEDPTPVRYFTSRKERFYTGAICAGCNGEDTRVRKLGLTSNVVYLCGTRGVVNQFWSCDALEAAVCDDEVRWHKYVCGVSDDAKNRRPYGYYAQKKTIRPTLATLGGWDYFRQDFVNKDMINCNADLSSTHYTQDQHDSPLPGSLKLLKDGYDQYDKWMPRRATFISKQAQPSQWPPKNSRDYDPSVEDEVYAYFEADTTKLLTKHSAIDGKLVHPILHFPLILLLLK